MLEENVRQVLTLSVGQIAVDGLAVAYCGTQRVTQDNWGRSIYGGSDLVCVRGGWDALDALAMEPDMRAGVSETKMYDRAMTDAPTALQSVTPDKPRIATVPQAATDVAAVLRRPQTSGQAPNVSQKMGAEMDSAGDQRASPDEQ